MALIDFLFKGKNDRLYNDMEAVENYADMQKADALKSKLKPALVPLQMDATGGLDAEATKKVQDFVNSPEARQQVLDERLAQAAAQKATPWQKVWGRNLTADIQTVDPQTNAVTMETKSLHQPGYFEKAGQGLKRGLNDILGGYGENRTQSFSTDNWNNNYLDNGNKKGLAYKLGEGLGSFAKLAESPVGRALLVGGIVGAGGGSGLQALAYGAQTGMLNQANRMKDQMYRNSLFESAKSSIMSSNLSDEEKERQIAEVANRINSYRGYVGDDTYKQILAGMQLKDNAEYKNALLASNLRNQQEMMEYRKQEAARKARQDAIDTDIAYKNIGLKEKELEQKGNNVKPLADTQVKDLKNLADALNDADGIIAKYSDSKYDAGFGISGAVRRNPLTSKFDPLATEMRQDIDLFRKTVARAKEGGRLTDQDQKYYEKAVLNPNLSREDFLSLAREFKNKIEQQRDTALDMYELQGKNVNNFRDYYQRERKGNTTQNGIKYEVID